MRLSTFIQVAQIVCRPTMADWECECSDCNRPGRIKKFLNEVLRVLRDAFPVWD